MARQSSMAAAFERIGGVNALPVILMVVSLPLVGSFSSWVTLTVAGLAMGMMIFLMASGLSLVFGLMDVLNFGHSAFISFGAFIAATVLAALAAWVGADSLTLNFLALFAALGAATLFGLAAGWFFERVIVKPVYSDHLRQILITIGALIVAEQIILDLEFWKENGALPSEDPNGQETLPFSSAQVKARIETHDSSEATTRKLGAVGGSGPHSTFPHRPTQEHTERLSTAISQTRKPADADVSASGRFATQQPRQASRTPQGASPQQGTVAPPRPSRDQVKQGDKKNKNLMIGLIIAAVLVILIIIAIAIIVMILTSK